MSLLGVTILAGCSSIEHPVPNGPRYAIIRVMSDSRFNLKVKFDIYDDNFEWEASLNWCADCGEIDRRIAEWFIECHDAARAKWDEKYWNAEADREKKEELKELTRLREKYPDA